MNTFITALVIAVCLGGAAASDVVVLTDENFEHDTQISTGATTGDWFIEFYAPWCGHCKNLAPTWEKLATELKGEVSVAKVDVTQNAGLGSRFSIKGFPTLKFFHHGQMYDYKKERSVDALKEFALGGYEKSEPQAAPGEQSFTDRLVGELKEAFTDMAMLVKRKTAAIFFIFALGMMVGVVVAMALFICCIEKPLPPVPRPPQGPPPRASSQTDASSVASEDDRKQKPVEQKKKD